MSMLSTPSLQFGKISTKKPWLRRSVKFQDAQTGQTLYATGKDRKERLNKPKGDSFGSNVADTAGAVGYAIGDAFDSTGDFVVDVAGGALDVAGDVLSGSADIAGEVIGALAEGAGDFLGGGGGI